jgi:hypothetical protein
MCEDAVCVKWLASCCLSFRVTKRVLPFVACPQHSLAEISDVGVEIDCAELPSGFLQRADACSTVESVAGVARAAYCAFDRHAAELHVLDDREAGRKRDVTPCAFSTR